MKRSHYSQSLSSYILLWMFGVALIVVGLLCCHPNLQAAPSVLPRGVTINNSSLAYQGYTVFSVEGKDKVFVIDMNGNEVHSWNIPNVTPQVKPLPNGHVLVIVNYVPNVKRALREYDWDGNMVWECPLPHKFMNFNHDVARLSSGNTLAIASVMRESTEFIPRRVIDNVIVEFNKNGDLVWEWSSLEHFNELGISEEGKNYINTHPDILDVFHTNSIHSLPANNHEKMDPRFKTGNILVSQRMTSKVFVIDRSTGSITWLADLGIGQHHASMIPGGLIGEGNILLFDNGGIDGFPPRFRAYSIVKEINPSTENIAWKYEASDNKKAPDTFFSSARSSVQRLPNGNTLIVESTFGRIFEVKQDKKIVWEYVSPHVRIDHYGRKTNQIYRAYRVDYTWPQGKVGPGDQDFVW